MRRLVLASFLFSSAVASADSGNAPVIGGSDASPGDWPDAVAVLFDGQQSCTGTLIHPKWVLTAGHCDDSSLDGVLIGTSSLSRPSEGETIPVIRRVEYPNSWQTFDLLLLELERESTREPRPIATGWARDDISNGAEVVFVGFGAVDRDGGQFVNELQEATSTITDFNCTTHQGCNSSAQPNGELGAGGGGIDTCPGDSGGPMYLVTEEGTFLAGVTSRGYDTNQFWCSEGGVYVRPDAVMEWIEDTTGETFEDAVPAIAEDLVAESGQRGHADVDPADPRDGTTHTFEIIVDPTHGVASIDEDGRVTYQSVDEYLGPDELVVLVTDADDPTRYARAVMQIEVVDDTGGCCQTGEGSSRGTATPVLIVLAALLWPRRRRVG